MGKVKLQNCPKCNSTFECYSETDIACWCNDVKLSNEVLSELSNTYKGCLCPECIKEFSEKSFGGNGSNQ